MKSHFDVPYVLLVSFLWVLQILLNWSKSVFFFICINYVLQWQRFYIVQNDQYHLYMFYFWDLEVITKNCLIYSSCFSLKFSNDLALVRKYMWLSNGTKDLIKIKMIVLNLFWFCWIEIHVIPWYVFCEKKNHFLKIHSLSFSW